MQIYRFICARHTLQTLSPRHTFAPIHLKRTINCVVFIIYIGTHTNSTVTGPRTIGGLILKLNEFGPTPLVSIYYDMSYGRKSQPMIIIDSSMESAPALQNPIRWLSPKSAPFDVKYDVPPLLATIVELFLPTTLEADRREFERDAIVSFIRELNQLRRESLRRGFTDSYVLYNVSTLSVSYPFVCISKYITI